MINKSNTKMENQPDLKNKSNNPFDELERSVYAALETYSNVHRGSGHFSMVTTHLFEQARDIVLEYLGLNKRKYKVIFCSALSASKLTAKLDTGSYRILSGNDFGLPLGVRAMAVKRNALPGSVPFQSGGGTARLMAINWVVWESAPDRFEAGTPAIINIIAFARALRQIKQSDKNVFMNPTIEKTTATEILYMDELDKYSGKKV